MLMPGDLEQSSNAYATTIYDLAKLVRKAHYVEQLDRVQHQDLLRLQFGNEVLGRLCRTMQETVARLVDCLHRENSKREFAELYTTMMNLADTVLEHAESRDSMVMSGVMSDLSEESRHSLLRFLHVIRTDHAWVAERLSSLTVSELDALLPMSEFAARQPSALREAHRDRDEIHDLQRKNALNSLLFLTFAPPGAFESEDRLRLDLTATILHRLIRDNKTSSKGDKFCLAAMDAWAGLYGWDASKSFEILLMEILQSGTRVIEKAEARSIHGNPQHRSYYLNNQSKRDDSEDEFFAIAVKNIFQLLNSPEIGGLPTGVIVLSRAILSRAEDGDKRHYESFIIINWFFYRFLSKAISYPEQLGLMNDYYISDVKRQRILVALLQRVHAHCVPTTKPNGMTHKRSLIDEEIEGHVLSIFSKFRMSKNDYLFPASLRSIGQDNLLSRSMQSYSDDAVASITLCATDLATLLTAVSPHCRVGSPEPVNSHLTRHKSTSSTGSGRSSGFKPARSSKITFDIGNALRDEEARSDGATDIDDSPELRRAPSNSYFTPILEYRVEDEIIRKAKDAILELLRDHDVRAASAITAESWDRIFVYPDHVSLVDPACRTEKIMSETPDEVHTAIHHLLDNFEIDSFGEIREPVPKEPSYFARISRASLSGRFHETISPPDSQSGSHLLQILLFAAQRCLAKRDYAAAGVYHKAHNKLQQCWQSAQALEDFSPILYGLVQEQDRIIEINEQHSDERMQLLAHAREDKARLLQLVDHTIYRMNKIRLKMWYISDIRRNKFWNQAWDVVKCLNKMRPPPFTGEYIRPGSQNTDQSVNPFSFHAHRPSSLSRSNSRDHRFPRFSRDLRYATASLNSSDGMAIVDQAIFEAIAVPIEQGGPNKLSGIQVQQTAEWMRTSDIHNFCQGEERVHRLCYEIDDLTKRIMKTNSAAPTTIDIDEAIASALWTFELFHYESEIFKIDGRVKNESLMSESILSTSAVDESSGSISGLLRRGSAGDLLNLARTAGRARVNSAGSLDNPHSRSRSCAGTRLPPSEISVETVDSAKSFSSFEQSTMRSHERSNRVSTSHAVKQVPEFDEQIVQDFLLQTQIGLTALLLSDFAELLFHRGSETDEWYNGELTETALARKQAQEINLQECIAENSRINLENIVLTPPSLGDLKQPLKTKKHLRGKSINLSHFFSGAPSPGESYKSAPAPPSVDVGRTDGVSGVSMERTSSASSYLDVMTGSDSSTTPVTPARSMHGRATQPQEFPLMRAYKEIMQKFSAHPSPYEKLRALYDFELLVVANLRSSGKTFDIELPKLAPTMPQSPMLQNNKSNNTISPATLKQHVHTDFEDLAKLRIEKLAVNALPESVQASATPRAMETPMFTPGTDAIVEEMQKILRIPSLRPKTLFRDLQYIASFIPATILNMTDEGKVFWDVGLAALGMKREAVEAMVQYGTSIIHQSEVAGQSVSSYRPNSQEGSLADAVNLFIIAAKEQDVNAMRELALLQSTKPEILAVIIPPFSIPSSIFAKIGRRERRPSINSASTETVNKGLAAKAWFELAAAEGDLVARSWIMSKRGLHDQQSPRV